MDRRRDQDLDPRPPLLGGAVFFLFVVGVVLVALFNVLRPQSGEEKAAAAQRRASWEFSRCSDLLSRLNREGWQLEEGITTVDHPPTYAASQGPNRLSFNCAFDQGAPPQQVCFFTATDKTCSARPREGQAAPE